LSLDCLDLADYFAMAAEVTGLDVAILTQAA
jgi:hypothetical protein